MNATKLPMELGPIHDPMISTEAGGTWWDVVVPEVSARKEVNAARAKYEAALKIQRAVN